MKILITGSAGFIGKNLLTRLKEIDDLQVLIFNKEQKEKELLHLVSSSDFIFHLAGVNRSNDELKFSKINVELTKKLCLAIVESKKNIPIVFTSSVQAADNNPYGKSKLAAEKVIKKLTEENGNPAYIYRLPGVFGKWCQPNYNSVVATFCYNIVRDLPIKLNEPDKKLSLVYIDDLMSDFIDNINNGNKNGFNFHNVEPIYNITVGQLASQIEAFKNSRKNLIYEQVGTGLKRALYSTFISYLPPNYFHYDLPTYDDDRGSFVEILKSIDTGQFSYFTAKPGVTRGDHYHHSKTEKFVVVRGSAKFKFRHLISDEKHEIISTGKNPTIIQTIPGWSHNIKNIGDDELIVILWANEIFDRNNPDTIASKV